MNKQEYTAYLESEHWLKLRASKREKAAKTNAGKNRCANGQGDRNGR